MTSYTDKDNDDRIGAMPIGGRPPHKENHIATSGKMVDNPIIQEAVLWLRAVPSLESETYVAERKVWLECAPNDIELAKSIRTHIKQIGKLSVELHAMRASFALSQRGKNTTTTEEK